MRPLRTAGTDASARQTAISDAIDQPRGAGANLEDHLRLSGEDELGRGLNRLSFTSATSSLPAVSSICAGIRSLGLRRCPQGANLPSDHQHRPRPARTETLADRRHLRVDFLDQGLGSAV
jgi:hypothetical protein